MSFNRFTTLWFFIFTFTAIIFASMYHAYNFQSQALNILLQGWVGISFMFVFPTALQASRGIEKANSAPLMNLWLFGAYMAISGYGIINQLPLLWVPFILVIAPIHLYLNHVSCGIGYTKKWLSYAALWLVFCATAASLSFTLTTVVSYGILAVCSGIALQAIIKQRQHITALPNMLQVYALCSSMLLMFWSYIANVYGMASAAFILGVDAFFVFGLICYSLLSPHLHKNDKQTI